MIRRGEAMLTPPPTGVGGGALAAGGADEGTTGREGAQQHQPRG